VVKDNADGSVDFSVTISGTEEIMKWILSFGSEAWVVGPEELKCTIRREIERLTTYYFG
jgi:proteasome accessory factor B